VGVGGHNLLWFFPGIACPTTISWRWGCDLINRVDFKINVGDLINNVAVLVNDGLGAGEPWAVGFIPGVVDAVCME
jgi:hypothetical protein